MQDIKEISTELYQLEAARQKFQENVSSLLEIQSTFSQKAGFAKGQKKEYISLTIDQAEIIARHLLIISGELNGSYDIINNTSKLLIFENRLLKRQVEDKTIKELS